jgi:hypothetical protein
MADALSSGGAWLGDGEISDELMLDDQDHYVRSVEVNRGDGLSGAGTVNSMITPVRS